MKYIRDEGDRIWVFPSDVSHEDFVSHNGIAPRSAGQVISENGKPFCLGNSMTLGLVSEKDDTEFLRNAIK